jgi:hypothetical protein
VWEQEVVEGDTGLWLEGSGVGSVWSGLAQVPPLMVFSGFCMLQV